MMANQRSSVPDWLFRTLQQAGLRVELGDPPAAVRIRLQDSKPIEFNVLTFPVLSLERAQEIVQSIPARHQKAQFLIAIRQLSERTRAMLRTSTCSWAEEVSGIVHIVAPGMLVKVSSTSNSKQQRESAARGKLRGRSGLLAEALLTSNPKDNIVLGAIASRAHVSNALASRVLARLSKINLIEVHGAGPNRFWRLTDRGALLDLWAAEEQQRPEKSYGLYVWSRSPQGLYERLPSLNHLTPAWALAGTAAANTYAPTLTTSPDPVIWIDARVPAEAAARTLQGEIADKGANIQLWQSERNLALELAASISKKSGSEQELRLVSKPRAYLETVRAAGRAPEIAQNLRERILSGNGPD